jgi:hypothetical protein
MNYQALTNGSLTVMYEGRPVYLRRATPEQISSASPPNSDIALRGRHFAFVPMGDIRLLANSDFPPHRRSRY